jgi:uncharacterized protein YbbC (DUF1343 family)
LFGGALLSFASHGVDYMMVQRVLTCGTLNSARKAVIGSGLFVFIQFSIFLMVGSLIWVYNGGADIEKDRELSSFIVNSLPVGIRGILLAGVLSAAMSTLSSSINSLASSTIHDWFNKKITISKSILISAFWSIILIFIALFFDEGDTSIIVLGLKIASFTYGSLLSLFILALTKIKFSNSQLLIGLFSGIISVFIFQNLGFAWTWFIGVSVLTNILISTLLNKISNKVVLSTIFIVPIFLYHFIFINNSHIPYMSGLDVLSQDKFKNLKDKRVGLVVNHTSVNNYGKHIIELALNHDVNIEAIFAPEHGFKGVVEAGAIIDYEDENGLEIPIYSLYGKYKKPTKNMLSNIDILVFDIQDIGVRYYTYISTLTLLMEAASENRIPLLILDRINPLGRDISGPLLDVKFSSFVGMHPIPIRHGMTVGELARMINYEGWLNNKVSVDLKIIKYKGDVTKKDAENVFKIKPSPNMPDLYTAWIYQGLCLLEGTNLSEGRGTEAPFLIFGAPWLDSYKLYNALQDAKSSDDDFEVVEFKPLSNFSSKNPKYLNQTCYGIRIRKLKDPIEWTINLLDIINSHHPLEFKFLDTNFIDKLYGSNKLRVVINEGLEVEGLIKANLENNLFKDDRKKHLLYDHKYNFVF